MQSTNVVWGDCIKLVPHFAQDTPFDFVFADPPFNTGQPYAGYRDFRGQDDYEQFTFAWVSACWKSCRGVLALHGTDDLVEIYLCAARILGMTRIAWINWHYRFGQCGRSKWVDARCHCLVFAKCSAWTWNPDAVLVKSDRVKYGDKRIFETKNGGKRLPGTVWGVPSDGPNWGRVQGNNRERRDGHPNQLPEVYLERLLLAYTNVGDRVLDPFGGSGTTAVVAQALKRKCVTIDISAENCKSIRGRLCEGAVRFR